MSSVLSRSVIAAITAACLCAVPLGASAAVERGSAATSESRGDLPSGGRYVLHEPEEWNGTLLMWSPGYGGGGQSPSAAPSETLREWLLEEGYAVAGASSATGGWAVEDLLTAQPEAVEMVAAELGEPDQVIAWGASMGGQVSAALMESEPEIFDAALPLCGSIAGAIPMLNGSLDGTFALKTLIAPGDDQLKLVDVEDEAARQAAFREVLDEAQGTAEGRARIALAASLAQMPTWSQVGTEQPHPHDLAAQQKQLYEIFMWGVVSPRQPLEERAGGNFSWNTGVDYTESLRESGNSRLVRGLYREAGLSLTEDLTTLGSADRISAEPSAVAYMQANATPTGDIAGPVLTLHETGDSAPVVAQAGTYADRVKAHGSGHLLRQAFVDRPGHCAYADAEVAAAMLALQDRLDSGRWGRSTHPRVLDHSADRIAERDGLERGGEFARYRPASLLRPERAPEWSDPAPGEDVRTAGALDGDLPYTAIKPADWNGTLVVAPGEASAEFASADWLLDDGSAVIGYELSDGWDLLLDRDNATAAYDAFASTIGVPETVVVSGGSQGGLVTRIVADDSPRWLDGALPMCGGGAGAVSTWNYKLDMAFALRELVDPDSAMSITGIDDLDAELAATNALVTDASATDEGRARIALGKIPAVDPDTGMEIPARLLDERIDRYIGYLPFAIGSHVRAGYEQTVGGVFSWNTGVDYTDALRESGRWREVSAAYRQAGLSLRDDLATLRSADRLTADPETVGFVERTASFTGDLTVPVLSISTTGDGAGSTQDDDAYAETVSAAGQRALLRQTFVASEGHCTFTAAEEAAAFDALFERIEQARWPSTSPRSMDRAAERADARSELELGDARFTHRPRLGEPARTWDVRDWGTYTG